MSDLALRQFMIRFYDFHVSSYKTIKLFGHSVKEVKRLCRVNHGDIFFESIKDVITGEELL